MLSSYPSDLLDEYATKHKWKVNKYDLNRAAGKGRKIECLTMNY